MAKPVREVGVSVRARLLNLARQRNQQFDPLLRRFVLERFLHRLALTAHRDRFALKGAILVTTWFANPHRATRDVDFLGFGDPDPRAMLSTFRDIFAVALDDGVKFDGAASQVERMREEAEYGGLRVKTTATVGGARVNVVIDVGFGDAIEPGLEDVEIPVLLDFPAPRLRAYARETVIAEKFQAMVALGLANSRMKDYYDIWMISRAHAFVDDRLAEAIVATFARRGTAIPTSVPDALTETFASDPAKLGQWNRFTRDIATQAPSLAEVINDLVSFLMVHASRAASWNRSSLSES